MVSLDDELHAGGVASLVTSSSMVVRLLHRHAQLHMHSVVGYVVVCDGFCGVAMIDFRCCNMCFLDVAIVDLRCCNIFFLDVATVDLRCCDMCFWMLQQSI
jgi:hypothetical protein